MDVWRWVHLAAMVLPVLIFTAFNITGLEPTPQLAGALSALTTGAALFTAKRPPQRKRRTLHEASNAAPKPKRIAPGRVALAEDDHRVP
jgi:hypothetical protein